VTLTAPAPAPVRTAPPPAARRGAAPWLVLAGCVLVAVARLRGEALLQTWSTVALAVVLQALPFLVLGVLLSGTVAAFVPPGLLPRLVPRRPALAVPMAGVLGLALPGCECSSVPVAGRLIGAGAPQAAALTFMLAAPAINPVVVVATAVAFPGQPEVPTGRVLASLLAAVTVGLLWARFGRQVTLCGVHEHHHGGARLSALRAALVEDFAAAAGWLVLGGATAATLQVLVPRSLLDGVAASPVAAVLVLAALAVLLAVCSEADAFVAAGLTQFSLTSRLVFLTVGPMVDVKLLALQVGTFGRGFVLRFAPLVLGCAVLSGFVVGTVLL
jgi:uncharacterized membrane protein YraQ (UPF0718 family)